MRNVQETVVQVLREREREKELDKARIPQYYVGYGIILDLNDHELS